MRAATSNSASPLRSIDSTTRAAQERALEILQFKLDVLWQMNDAMASAMEPRRERHQCEPPNLTSAAAFGCNGSRRKARTSCSIRKGW